MPPIRIFAPAKVNLTLHVTGQRADGYHLLDSLVAFAPVGDWVEVSQADHLSLSVDGPEAAGVPTDDSNLVVRAVLHHARKCGLDGRLALRLTKALPPASGIGGGSSDAAAALRGVMALLHTPELWCRDGKLAVQGHAMAEQAILDLAGLGADVAMCHAPAPVRVRGIGEMMEPTPLPPLPAVLVNPRVEVPTSAVFRALACKDNAPMPAAIPAFAGPRDCILWLRDQRNDLEAPAILAAPVIADVMAALNAQTGVCLARMSGSGATCFALFDTVDQASAACVLLRHERPDWWLASGVLGDQTGISAAQVTRATT
jgi:4-diphosphocytidyl-2-C-methyl-D-erythritol kinase